MVLLGALLSAAPARAQFAAVLERLDLTRPGLEQVRAAIEAGDAAKAAAELKGYFQRREEPFLITDRHSRPEPNASYDTGGAEKTLRREYAFVGKPATLTHEIDWNADPHKDVEWPIELNRHGTWVTLSRAYWHTHDEKYAEDLAYQVSDWLTKNPHVAAPQSGRWTWRTLECGIRLGGSWPEVFFRALDSEHFTPELVCAMLEGIWQQCDFLMRRHGGGNWLICEKSGLVTTGIVFPEFRDAETWLSSAWEVLTRELTSQVYPDGAQGELTPHYHSATLSSFRRAYDIAQRNGVEPPAAYRDNMERMYEYLMYVVKPDGYIPMFNDSDHGNMRGWMRDGASRFDRQDMLFVATGGEEGTAPAGPSHWFAWAGQAIMRSGWTSEDIYLAMDVGPYGLGHQHEDKLTIDVWGQGQEMIVDPGRYTYAGGKWRPYFVSTASHSTLLVDGKGQNRRRTPRSKWVIKQPLHNRWISNDDLDLAVGSYEDGYGEADLIHVREVLFVRPDYFVVSDLLLPGDDDPGEHEAMIQFQLARPGAQLDEATLAVHSVGPEANVLIHPASPENLRVTMHEGEEDPPRGWVGWSLHAAHKEAATLVQYSQPGQPTLGFDTVVLPYRGEAAPNLSVRRLPVRAAGAELARVQATALEIAGDGWRDLCYISHQAERRPARFADVSTDAEIAVVRFADGPEPEKVAFIGGTGVWLGSEARAPGGRADAAPRVELAANQIEVTSDEPTAFSLRYGYAAGGGFLFETPLTEPTTSATLKLHDPRRELGYVYEAVAHGPAGPRVVQRGTLLIPEPRAFDFEDGTLQEWAGPNAKLVAGFEDSSGALRVEEPPTTEAKYISVGRPHRLKTSDEFMVRFAYRAPVADGGTWFYTKVTLRDSAGLDWSAYFARQPSPEWQEVNLGIADFRGDTQETPEQGKAVPTGLKITRVSVTQRKDETAEPVAPCFELDDFRIGD